VSNSTPPPAASPQPVKIKAEPISPPRDHHNSGHPSTIISGHSQQQQTTITTMSSSGGGGGGGGLQHTTTSLGNNLSHSHLLSSRPSSSTGHLTPTSGELTTISFGKDLIFHQWPSFAGGGGGGSVTPTNAPSPIPDLRHNNGSHMSDYDSPNSHKRPRISEGWST
jgi:hypothetical protein